MWRWDGDIYRERDGQRERGLTRWRVLSREDWLDGCWSQCWQFRGPGQGWWWNPDPCWISGVIAVRGASARLVSNVFRICYDASSTWGLKERKSVSCDFLSRVPVFLLEYLFLVTDISLFSIFKTWTTVSVYFGQTVVSNKFTIIMEVNIRAGLK